MPIARPSPLAAPLLAAAAMLLTSGTARADARREAGRWIQVVAPGESIQWALDHARDGGWVLVRPGTYRESADATNGLTITRSVHLVGLKERGQGVVLENAGGQMNGIVAVPAAHRRCMDCHESLAPPFPRKPGVAPSGPMTAPAIDGLTVQGLTIRGFGNNGLFTRGVDHYRIVDVHSVDNPNYGIFPVSSNHGVITRSSARGADDSGIWVETSTDVRVTHNLVEGNVNGFEISNSQDVLVAHNEVRDNTVGIASFFLPDIFGVQGFARRVTIRDNHVHDNNRPNAAREGAILSTVPSGTGILVVGVAVADYCAVVAGGPFDCAVDPTVTPGFVALNEATGDRVLGNVVLGNGANPDPASPFAFAASDLALLTAGDHGTCYAGNRFGTFFSLIGVLPACPEARGLTSHP